MGTCSPSTPRIKQGWHRRNGLPVKRFDHADEHFIRHGGAFTHVSIVTDPVYLSEPLIKSEDYTVDDNTGGNWLWPCEYVNELPDSIAARVQSFLPGTNPFLTEYAGKHGLTQQDVLGDLRQCIRSISASDFFEIDDDSDGGCTGRLGPTSRWTSAAQAETWSSQGQACTGAGRSVDEEDVVGDPDLSGVWQQARCSWPRFSGLRGVPYAGIEGSGTSSITLQRARSMTRNLPVLPAGGAANHRLAVSLSLHANAESDRDAGRRERAQLPPDPDEPGHPKDPNPTWMGHSVAPSGGRHAGHRHGRDERQDASIRAATIHPTSCIPWNASRALRRIS